MCGIIGIVRTAPLSEADRRFVQVGTALLEHRGPDGGDTWSTEKVSFGHRRLAVIDLQGGRQPMHDATGRYTISYNGEIYNYRDLMRDLESRNYQFLTISDTEVILNAYAEWGKECVTRFDGIFSFAIWDNVEESLFLARDHLGVKPLVYSEIEGGLIFGSEVTAVVSHPEVDRSIDLMSLSDYLSIGYVLAPKTIVKGACKLSPGFFLTWKDGSTKVERYWDLAAIINAGGNVAPLPDVLEELDQRLDSAVRGQLVSDIPIGLLLSGGLDSSTVAQRMSAAYPDRVRSFSMGFNEKSYSELPYARLVAESLGTDHSEEIMDIDLEDVMPLVARCYDEPFADTSAVPTYCLCRGASRNVKVVLSGDGGDECFAGYDTYLADKVKEMYAKLVPGFLHREIVRPFFEWLPASRNKVDWNYKGKQFCRFARKSHEEAHYGWRLLFSEQEKRQLWGEEISRQIGDYDPLDVFLDYYREVQDGDWLNRSLYVDMKTWLPDAMLVKVDRASMACGLEVRVPLLDRALVEFVMSLPANYKLKGFKTKLLLKELGKRRLPAKIVHRRKRGFNAPVSHWVRGLVEPKNECHLPELQGVWGELKAEHARGRSDNGFKMWALNSWVQWCEVHGMT